MPYTPAGKAWGGAMASFFGSPQQMAEMPKSPLSNHLGGLALKPVEFNLAMAPIVQELEAFGLERFEALSGPAKIQAIQHVLPKAVKAVAAKALALETAALAQDMDEANMTIAAEGLRQLEQSFGVFAAAGGFATERLSRARTQASWRLGRLRGIRMDGEMRRLQASLLGQPAAGEPDAVVMQLQEKALKRPLWRDEAVMELLAMLRAGGPERQLSVLKALSAISAAMSENAPRVDLAAELSPALTSVKDSRVLAAGHLLLGRLDPARTPSSYPTAASGGSLAKFGIHGFRTARLTNRPAKIPAFTDGGELYAFKVRRRTDGKGSLIGLGLRASLFRLLRRTVLVATSVGAVAATVSLYHQDNPLFADMLAALLIIASLVFLSFTAKAGSKGDATAGGRTPL